MSEPVLAHLEEREIYRDYERNRRLQLAGTLLPVLASIQFAVFLVSVVFSLGAHYGSPIKQIFIFNTILVGFNAAFHALGMRFVWRRQVTQATVSAIVPLGLTIIVPLLVYDLFPAGPNTASPILAITLSEMVATLVIIVLAGILAASRWPLIVTTLVMNLFTVFILISAFQATRAGGLLRGDAVLLISFPILVQWSVAGILLAASRTYLSTLRELGDVRIAYTRAQQLDQLKDQFIAHINHELRSPVMALQGHVELLLLAEDKLSAEERHTYLERAKHVGDDLVSLVTSILAVRRLEQQVDAFTPESVSVSLTLESAIRLIDPREGQQMERDLHLHVPPDLQVWAEPVRLRQILTNLLSNAIKYSPSGTPVEVTAAVMLDKSDTPKRWHRQQHEPRQMVEITVRDHGLGIPPDQIPLLFKRFVRLPRDLASNVPGNGLGLYLSQTLATAMGGTLWVESSGIEGEGSVFHLLLPVSPPITEGSVTSAPFEGSAATA
ncbi:MAG: sensor histidine kinase [Ktedonobacterales bacterium]